jgi:hypothetical protein
MLPTCCAQDINSVYGQSVDNWGLNGLSHAEKPSSAEPVAPMASRTPDVCATAAKRKTRRTAAQIGYSPAFDRFWEVYPARRGMSRPAAFKNWLAQNCEPVADDVILGAREYADDVETSRRKNKGWSDSYIKHAQGWLTERRWEGYVMEVRKREAARIELENRRLAEIQRQEAEAAAKAAMEEETLEQRQARMAEFNRLRLIEDAADIASMVVQCAELEKAKNSYVSTRLWEKLVGELRILTKMLMPKRWRDFSRYPRETAELIINALAERGLLDMLNGAGFVAAPA